MHSFVYDASWLKSPKVRSLPQSLPITTSSEVRGDAVANDFYNLLGHSLAYKELRSHSWQA